VALTRVRRDNPLTPMNTRLKTLFGAAALAAGAVVLSACAGGYVEGGGGVAVVDTDYYGPGWGGQIGYGHPYYRNDSHVVAPPHQAWHGSASHGSPHGGGGGGHAAPSGGGGHERK